MYVLFLTLFILTYFICQMEYVKNLSHTPRVSTWEANAWMGNTCSLDGDFIIKGSSVSLGTTVN